MAASINAIENETSRSDISLSQISNGHLADSEESDFSDFEDMNENSEYDNTPCEDLNSSLRLWALNYNIKQTAL